MKSNPWKGLKRLLWMMCMLRISRVRMKSNPWKGLKQNGGLLGSDSFHRSEWNPIPGRVWNISGGVLYGLFEGSQNEIQSLEGFETMNSILSCTPFNASEWNPIPGRVWNIVSWSKNLNWYGSEWNPIPGRVWNHNSSTLQQDIQKVRMKSNPWKGLKLLWDDLIMNAP